MRHLVHLRTGRGLVLIAAACLSIAPRASAGVTEDQILVVYNSASTDAVTLLGTYLTAHPGIPANHLLDLNNASLLVSDVTQAQLAADIRDPIRAHLTSLGATASQDILVILLLRPFPHRVLDTDAALAGDNGANAGAEINAGDATYASVDSDLTLLWQDLYTGESGGTMDSKSDNLIDNPYHMSAAGFDTFDRSNIESAKSFLNRSNVAWGLTGSGANRLTAGDMYLVGRIDATTLADAQAIINRAQNVTVNRAATRVILDEYDDALSGGDGLDDDPLFPFNQIFFGGEDYEDCRDALLPDGWDVRYDATFNFINAAEEPRPLIAYASYGRNHRRNGWGEDPGGCGTYLQGFTFAPGAIFNTAESFNGRALNGLGTLACQEQAADFITEGGTFAIGNVFEPFTFSMTDNEWLLPRMLVDQMTWIEAAYAAIPGLSWQMIVVGDPLAQYAGVIDQKGDCDANALVNTDDWDEWAGCVTGPGGSAADGCQCADADSDSDVDMRDIRLYTNDQDTP